MGLNGDRRQLTGKVSEVEMGRRTSSLSEKGTMDLQSAERFIPWNCQNSQI